LRSRSRGLCRSRKRCRSSIFTVVLSCSQRYLMYRMARESIPVPNYEIKISSNPPNWATIWVKIEIQRYATISQDTGVCQLLFCSYGSVSWVDSYVQSQCHEYSYTSYMSGHGATGSRDICIFINTVIVRSCLPVRRFLFYTEYNYDVINYCA